MPKFEFILGPRFEQFADYLGGYSDQAAGAILWLEFWMHSARCNGDLTGIGSALLERHARWSGERGCLYSALIRSGLIVVVDQVDPNGDRIQFWKEFLPHAQQMTQRKAKRAKLEQPDITYQDCQVLNGDWPSIDGIELLWTGDEDEEQDVQPVELAVPPAPVRIHKPQPSLIGCDEDQAVEAICKQLGWGSEARRILKQPEVLPRVMRLAHNTNPESRRFEWDLLVKQVRIELGTEPRHLAPLNLRRARRA